MPPESGDNDHQVEPLKVFISYTHDSPEHSRRVLELSNCLREEGFDCDIDQYHANQNWPAWMERNIEHADFVLVICTPTYLRRWHNEEQPGVGLGAQWESLLTRQHLYFSGGLNNKFVPVVFQEDHISSIPTPLANVTRVVLLGQAAFERIKNRLLDIAPAEKPPLRTSLAPFTLADGFFTEPRNQTRKQRPIRGRSNPFDHQALGLLPSKERMFSNLFPIIYPPKIQVAKVALKRGTRFPEFLQKVWKELGNTGSPPMDFFIDARVLYRFGVANSDVWDAMARRKVLRPMPEKNSSDWAQSKRMADKNYFIRLLNSNLDQVCAAPSMVHRLSWSREMKCHLFIARPGTRVGTITVRAIKREGTREVYKAIRDKTSSDPDSIQHWKHQAFRHFFVRFGDRWFLNVIPFWAFTRDGRGYPSRWQKSSSANMRKPEKNCAVLGHIMFWASILCKDSDLLRPSEPFRIERPIELELAPSVNDVAWINIAREAEKKELLADMELPL